MQTMGANPMEAVIAEMLGSVIEDAVTKAIQPLLERMSKHEAQMQEYLDIIDAFRSKGSILSKLLGG